MQVQSAQEALFLACEMERGAARLYERALMLLRDLGRADDPLLGCIARMHVDEQRHLAKFESLYTGLDEPVERRLMLSAVADGVLFEGGLMGAVREGLLEDAESMLRLALDAEEKAEQTYRAFAGECRDPEASAVLLGIAGEEARHWDELERQLKEIGAVSP